MALLIHRDITLMKDEILAFYMLFSITLINNTESENLAIIK